MTRKYTLSIAILSLLFLSMTNVFAQLGGRYTYDFLAMPTSGRITGLGGIAPLAYDDDVNLASINPALINEKMKSSIAFNHNYHFGGLSNGHVGVGYRFKSFNVHTSFTYFNYGDFQSTNEYGEVTGNFKVSDRALIIGASRQLNERITIGANIKSIFSSIENYRSVGMAGDIALNYLNPNSNFCATFLIRNIGGELSTYNENGLQAPLDIQIGFTKRLAHLPLRFSIFGHQLQQWNVRYDNPDEVKETDLFGNTKELSGFSKNIDNFFRHILINAELLIGKNENFKIRGGFNYQRRQELNLSSIRSMAGFSLGFGLKIKKFSIDYGIGYYHLAGAANHLSIYTNLDRFKKKV